MGWWQDFKKSYQYQKDLKEHQRYTKSMQVALAEKENTPGKGECEREIIALQYREEQAPRFREAPKPPEKPSFWGKLFGRMSAGSTTLPQKEQDAYERTQRDFSKSAEAVANREVRRAAVEGQLATNAATAERISHMSKGENARRSAYDEAMEGTKRPSNPSCNRIAPAMMEVPPANATPEQIEEAKTHNRETVALLNEYSDMVKASNEPENAASVDQARYAQVTQQVADKLKPIIAEAKTLSQQLLVANDGREAGYGPEDSMAWMTPEVADGVRKQYQSYMAISDFTKKTGNGSAGVIACGSEQSVNEYQDAANHLSTYYFGARRRAIQDFNGASDEQINTLVLGDSDQTAMDQGGFENIRRSMTSKTQTTEIMHAKPAAMSAAQKQAYDQNVANIPVATGATQAAPAPKPAAPAPMVESMSSADLAREMGKPEPKKQAPPPVKGEAKQAKPMAPKL